jgi:peroxiredoxin
VFWRTVVRATEDSKYADGGPWGTLVAMLDGSFRMLATGASWSGHERNHLFLGTDGRADFVRVTGISGLDDPGDSMSAAQLDLDRDGWMDVALHNVGSPRLRLLRNRVAERQGEAPNRFVALRFEGGNRTSQARPGWSARDALGARVVLELPGNRRLLREHSRNDGFKSQHTSTMLVGLGGAERVETLRVRWPSGREQTVVDVPSGLLLTLYEDAATSPTGEAEVRAAYVPGADRAALRLDGYHGERGLTLYTTMSTSCAACASSMPDLEGLRRAFGEEELTMVGVPVDEDDSPEDLRAYATRRSPPYRLATDLSKATLSQVRATVASALHGEGGTTPASFVTDAEGNILASRWGVPTLSELKSTLAEAQD